MQFLELKARKESDAEYHIVLGSIDLNGNGEHEARLSLMDRRYPRAKTVASEIHITSRNFEVLCKQIKAIAEIYPPLQESVHVLNLEELRKHYE